MTNPTPNLLSPQSAPNNSARCLGSGSYEDGKWHWREGCDDCQRRYGWAGGWIDPPPIIAFECEYRIGPDKIVPQGEHAPVPEPPSLKEQALEELDELLAAVKQLGIFNPPKNIRRALEQLND